MVKNLPAILEKHVLWLRNKGGARADLPEADLSEANLSWADLSWADLSGADLSWANLSGADLSRADLSGADLSWANLSEANLSGADLSGADLSEADLSEADLSGADLSWADLSGANLWITVWPLWCGTKRVKIDLKIARQLAAHFCAVECNEPEYQKAKTAILEFAKLSHVAKLLGINES